jgi:30S ribosomal protein S31
MGKGDKKTKRGKIFKGSFGKSRPASDKKITGNKPSVKKEG